MHLRISNYNYFPVYLLEFDFYDQPIRRTPDLVGKVWNIYFESTYRVFIKNCVFSKILKYIPDSGLSRFPLGVNECTQWQVKHQCCSSRTCRVQKNHNILGKNTIFNEHPVYEEVGCGVRIRHFCFQHSENLAHNLSYCIYTYIIELTLIIY